MPTGEKNKVSLFFSFLFEKGNRLKSEENVDKIIRLGKNYFDQSSLEN